MSGAASTPNFFQALGLDGRTMLFDALAFLIVALVLERYVYPVLIKALDRKRHELTEAARLQSAAQQKLDEAREAAADVLAKALVDGHKVVAEARQEAADLLQSARTAATGQAQRIVAEGQRQLERDVTTARQSLKRDTAELVALAAGRIVGRELNRTSDARLISHSLENK